MMMWFLIGLGAGAVAGVLAGILIASSRIARERKALQEEKGRCGATMERLANAEGELSDTREENTVLRVKLEGISRDKETESEKNSWLATAEEKLRDTFKALASDSLQSNSAQFASRAQEKLDHFQKEVKTGWAAQKEEIDHMVQPLQTSLKALDSEVREMEQKRAGAYKALDQHITHLKEAYEQLRDTTTGLTTALTTSSSSRGTWGEMQLRRVVELAGMSRHVDFEEQERTDGNQPDMKIKLPGGGVVPLDSKTTLQSYLSVMDADNDALRKERLKAHAAVVRTRIQELANKAYWEQFEHTPDFVVMFLPHEGFLAAAFEGDKDLLDYAFSRRVVLSSPVSLLALLKTISFGWQQQEIALHAQEIAARGKELYERLVKFISHLKDSGRNLDRTVDSYNKAISSLESRVLPSARRFREMRVSNVDLPELAPIDHQARIPASDDPTP